MKINEWAATQIEGFHNDPEYLFEQLILRINEDISGLMDEQKMSKADLARLLDVKRPFITKLLGGTPNITLQTLVKVSAALGQRVRVEFVPATKDIFETCALNGGWWEANNPDNHVTLSVTGNKRELESQVGLKSEFLHALAA